VQIVGLIIYISWSIARYNNKKPSTYVPPLVLETKCHIAQGKKKESEI